MRRILIDNTVLQLAKRYANVMQGKKEKSDDPDEVNWRKSSMPKQRLEDLKTFLGDNGYDTQAEYVGKIIDKYETILLLTPDKFEEFHRNNFAGYTDADLDKQIELSDEKKPKFHELLVDRMRYNDIRSNLFRKYMKWLNIKTCVYCNAQYAVTTDEFTEINERGQAEIKRIGTYQLDHFYPKSKYPYLCTSFFNLQPSCATCNGTKNDRDSHFYLYTAHEADQNVFTFKITPNKPILDINAVDMESIEITLDCVDRALLEEHQKLFHIDLIYAHHVDVVEEIIVKLHTYSTDYLETLTEGLGRLFPMRPESPERFFFGYYMDPDKIHYRPHSKLVQDTVAQYRS